MKSIAWTLAFLVSMAVVALAQGVVQPQPQQQGRRSSLTVTYWPGYGYGCGYRYGGYGYGGYGYGYGYGYGTGVYYGVGVGIAGDGYSSYYDGPMYYTNPMSGGPYFGNHRYRDLMSPPGAAAAGPASRPVADRVPEFTAVREIEEGRRRLKAGDYRGAVDGFRSAVAATPDDPAAQAWFAAALILAGDGKNADKALRSAAAGGVAPDRISLADAFRDDPERVRIIVALSRVTGEGAFAAAFVLDRAGEPVPLKRLAEKDPAARRLLPR
jgi:hypothetical protein